MLSDGHPPGLSLQVRIILGMLSEFPSQSSDIEISSCLLCLYYHYLFLHFFIPLISLFPLLPLFLNISPRVSATLFQHCWSFPSTIISISSHSYQFVLKICFCIELQSPIVSSFQSRTDLKLLCMQLLQRP